MIRVSHSPLLLLGEPSAGNHAPHIGGFLNREDQCSWMCREKGGSRLFILEKERLLTKGSAHTIASSRRQEKRQDGGRGSQLFDHSWTHAKSDRLAGCRAC